MGLQISSADPKPGTLRHFTFTDASGQNHLFVLYPPSISDQDFLPQPRGILDGKRIELVKLGPSKMFFRSGDFEFSVRTSFVTGETVMLHAGKRWPKQDIELRISEEEYRKLPNGPSNEWRVSTYMQPYQTLMRATILVTVIHFLFLMTVLVNVVTNRWIVKDDFWVATVPSLSIYWISAVLLMFHMAVRPICLVLVCVSSLSIIGRVVWLVALAFMSGAHADRGWILLGILSGGLLDLVIGVNANLMLRRWRERPVGEQI